MGKDLGKINESGWVFGMGLEQRLGFLVWVVRVEQRLGRIQLMGRRWVWA